VRFCASEISLELGVKLTMPT